MLIAGSLVFLIVGFYLTTYLVPYVFGDNGENMSCVSDALRRLKSSKNQKSISIEEFRQRTSGEGTRELWTVCFGHVINLKGFVDTHPGGTFLDHFIGRDMTPWMIITHAKSTMALKQLTTRSIGPLETQNSLDGSQNSDPFNLSLLTEIDADYVRLFFEFNKRGLFVTHNAWTIRDIMEVYLPYFLGYFLSFHSSYYWIGVCLMGYTGSRQGIFYHDIMHRSVFTCALRARRFVYYTSILLWGFDFNVVGDIHDIHHGFVNVIGLDTAIDMPLLPVDPQQLENGKLGFFPILRKYLGAANAYFYGFLAWMVLPYYSLYPLIMYFSAAENILFRVIVNLLRIALTLILWDYHKPMVIGAAIGFFYFASVGSLNHFHKKMTTIEQFFPSGKNSEPHSGEMKSFVALQTQTVQNTDHGPFVDALLGHFTLHIEHHLFPMMPRRAYPLASKDIQNLLHQYNLEYSVCSQSDAFAAFNNTIRNPHSKINVKDK